MTAYVIADTRIKDLEAYEDYKAQAKRIAESYGGVYRARGGKMKAVETELWTPTRLVIIEFPSMEAAEAFVNSPEYAPVKALRHAHADSTLTIIEGISA